MKTIKVKEFVEVVNINDNTKKCLTLGREYEIKSYLRKGSFFTIKDDNGKRKVYLKGSKTFRFLSDRIDEKKLSHKIYIRLDSVHYTHEETAYCYHNPIAINWQFPFLPRKGELFDCESIMIDEMPDFDPGICHYVEFVSYDKTDGEIRVIINTQGE